MTRVADIKLRQGHRNYMLRRPLPKGATQTAITNRGLIAEIEVLVAIYARDAKRIAALRAFALKVRDRGAGPVAHRIEAREVIDADDAIVAGTEAKD